MEATFFSVEEEGQKVKGMSFSYNIFIAMFLLLTQSSCSINVPCAKLDSRKDFSAMGRLCWCHDLLIFYLDMNCHGSGPQLTWPGELATCSKCLDPTLRPSTRPDPDQVHAPQIQCSVLGRGAPKQTSPTLSRMLLTQPELFQIKSFILFERLKVRKRDKEKERRKRERSSWEQECTSVWWFTLQMFTTGTTGVGHW